MQKKKIKIIFFGLGSAGQRHLKNLKNLNLNIEIYYYKKTKTNFIITNNLQKKNGNLLKKYNVTLLKTIGDIKKINPDIAFICNPSSEHTKYALICANLGCDLFIEKPISNNFENLKKLMKVVKKKKLVVSIGYQFLFHPLLQKLKYIIKSKKYGELQNGFVIMNENVKKYRKYGTYKDLLITQNKSGGGVLLEQSHDLNSLLWLMGAKPKLKNCFRYRDRSLHFDKGLEDSAQLCLSFQTKKTNRCKVYLLLSSNSDKKEKNISLFFSKARVNLDLIRNILEIEAINKKTTVKSNISRNDLFINEIKQFFVKIKKRIINDVSAEQSLQTLNIILRAKKYKLQQI